MSLTDNPDYDIINGTRMMVFPETVIRKAVKELKGKMDTRYDDIIIGEIFGELAEPSSSTGREK